MENKIPDPIWLFRIVHIQNLEHIFQYGLHTANSVSGNPNYVSIGDLALISVRNSWNIRINPPNGVLGEYIPFYFGYRSPMLYKIKTGYGTIKMYPQEEIVYLCVLLEEIVEFCLEWCFTDGHAKKATTQFFNNLSDLDKIDWRIVYTKDWQNTDEDFDRIRRKQAEFLVKNHVPAHLINRIVVYNDQAAGIVNRICQRLSLNKEVLINPKQHFYY